MEPSSISLPFHTDEFQVTSEIACIESADGEAVAEPSHGGFEIGFVEVGVEVRGLVDGGVHVCPHEWDGGPWDSSAFVGDFDGDVLFALCDDDFGDWKGFLIGSMRLNDGSQRVF